MQKLLLYHDCGCPSSIDNSYNQYQRLQRKKSTLLVGRINSEYSYFDLWVPSARISYEGFLSRKLSAIHYKHRYDIALVTPLRDGIESASAKEIWGLTFVWPVPTVALTGGSEHSHLLAETETRAHAAQAGLAAVSMTWKIQDGARLRGDLGAGDPLVPAELQGR